MPFFTFCGLLATAVLLSSARADSPAVEIEVVHEGVRSFVAPQEWAEILGRAGFARVSIRGRRSGDVPGVENIGSAQLPRYRVIAFLRDDKIVLPPSERFGKRDAGKIRTWVDQLRKGGLDTPENPKGPFGLSPQQLNVLRNQLATRVQEKTKGETVDHVVDRLLDKIRPAVEISAQARQELATQGVVTEELTGVATGTALAALLRPLGLGLKPQTRRGGVFWRIVAKQPKEEVWPVGWQSDQSAARTIPVLGKQVETQEVTLSLISALDQLAANMEVPLLLDARELSAEKIDPAAKVSMRSGRFIYSAVIRHLLRQLQLSFAVRLDDAAQPFLWVSTHKSLQSR